MKVTDLMLNDLVLYRGQVARVIGIYSDGQVRLCIYGQDIRKSMPAETLSPIPITPEILEKNGWKLLPRDTSHIIEYLWSTGGIAEYADIRIYVRKDHDDMWRWDFPTLNIHLYRGEIELNKFHYVHELQHTIKNCRINKEIIV